MRFVICFKQLHSFRFLRTEKRKYMHPNLLLMHMRVPSQQARPHMNQQELHVYTILGRRCSLV